MLNRNLPPVPVSTFSMVPRSDVPRSTFVSKSGYKTTFSAAQLIPFFVEEVLPGDTFKGKLTFFLRMATPLWPVMDNLYFETFYFYVPNRIVWTNWQKMMGQQDAPGDSISYTVPQVQATLATGFAQFGVADFFGLPVTGTQVTVAPLVNALPFRMYAMIYNEWFRDENLSAPIVYSTGDATQNESVFPLQVRKKRPDYFTSALPWPLKGGVSVPLPMAGNAVVKTGAAAFTGAQAALALRDVTTGNPLGAVQLGTLNAPAGQLSYGAAFVGGVNGAYPSNLYADLSTATGATINAMRLAVASQQFLEKDARGGTRYAELLRMHFGVTPQDARLDRPEYIGGGSSMLHTQAIPQTAPSASPAGVVGQLAGATVGNGSHNFGYAASEHGFIIGILNVRADITYMQGIHRSWTRLTRFDYYWPTFAFLGEQIIRQDEIYATGVVATDTAAFGYQERWSEYRYRPSRITGKFRSLISGTLDAWHLAESFTAAPALNAAFMDDKTYASVKRAVAAGAAADNQQFLFDSVLDLSATRAMPSRSVPGLLRF
ncbi:MAG: major capsid protein [Microvirus sp.]|nr:MAG: major capsid protein [Microvirus sp.]